MLEIKRQSEIRRACAERYAREMESLRSHREAGGKTAGSICHAFPTALLAGLGIRPVRMLCGASADAETAGEKFARADVCPLVKSMLGNVSLGTGLHTEIDLWIGLATCDQMRRGLDALADEIRCEVHPVQLPATRSAEAADYYAGQVRRLVADIEKRHGRTFDEEKARAWHDEKMRAARVLSAAARSGKVSPTDLHELFHLFFIAKPQGLADFFENLIENEKPFNAKKRIILTGSPLAREDSVILETLEARGAAVIPLNCTGLNCVDGPVDESAQIGEGDTIRRLAIEAFYSPPCARARPNAEVFDRIARELESSGAGGLIVKCLKFCDGWYTERERMREKFDVPVLVFDSAFSEGERERTIGRVEAFLEMCE